MIQPSPIMQAAAKAAQIVASWSKSKQEYAARIVNQQLGATDV